MATFEYPNATSTVARGINNLGWVVGEFTDASFTYQSSCQKWRPSERASIRISSHSPCFNSLLRFLLVIGGRWVNVQ
jgi:hypothetical protein